MILIIIEIFLLLFLFLLGLIHYESLELLSNQSAAIIQNMRHGNEKLFEDISSYFHIRDNDDDELTLNSLTINNDNEFKIPSLDILSQNFTAYQTQLRSTVSVNKLLEIYESTSQYLTEWKWIDAELDHKVILKSHS